MKVPACVSLEKSQAQVTAPNYLPKFKTPNLIWKRQTQANSQCPRFQPFANKERNEAFFVVKFGHHVFEVWMEHNKSAFHTFSHPLVIQKD